MAISYYRVYKALAKSQKVKLQNCNQNFEVSLFD